MTVYIKEIDYFDLDIKNRNLYQMQNDIHNFLKERSTSLPEGQEIRITSIIAPEPYWSSGRDENVYDGNAYIYYEKWLDVNDIEATLDISQYLEED